MNRYSAPILLVLLFFGCRNHAPTTDPFFGRTIIPPPGTGSATGRCPDPYYQTPPIVQMPAAQAPPTVQTPPATSAQPSAGVSPYSAPRPLSTAPGGAATTAPSTVVPPPGTSDRNGPSNGNSTDPPTRGWVPPGSTSTTPNASQPGRTVSLPAAAGVTSRRADGSLDDRTPRPVDAADGSGGNPSPRAPIIRTLQPRPKTNGDGGRVIDLMDLPPAS